MDMSFHDRKKERKDYYEKYIKGWKLIRCGACSGSGYYDHNGSPPCGACDGTGKERVSPKDYERWKKFMEETYGKCTT